MSGNISFLGQNSCCPFLPPCQLQCWHHRMFKLSSVSYVLYDRMFVFYLSYNLYGGLFCILFVMCSTWQHIL